MTDSEEVIEGTITDYIRCDKRRRSICFYIILQKRKSIQIPLPRYLPLEIGQKVRVKREREKIKSIEIKHEADGFLKVFSHLDLIDGFGESRWKIKPALDHRDRSEAYALLNRVHHEGAVTGRYLIATDPNTNAIIGTLCIYHALRFVKSRRKELNDTTMYQLRNKKLHLRIAWIRRIGVLPSHEEQGVAKALVRAAEDFAKTRFYPKPYLIESITRQEQFFFKGFEKRMEVDDNGEDIFYYFRYLDKTKMMSEI